jgi:hypothetical protein
MCLATVDHCSHTNLTYHFYSLTNDFYFGIQHPVSGITRAQIFHPVVIVFFGLIIGEARDGFQKKA